MNANERSNPENKALVIDCKNQKRNMTVHQWQVSYRRIFAVLIIALITQLLNILFSGWLDIILRRLV